jgi:hypothetical protein
MAQILTQLLGPQSDDRCRPHHSWLLQPHLFQRRRPGIGVDQQQRRFLHARSDAAWPVVLPDGGEPDPLMEQLLDSEARNMPTTLSTSYMRTSPEFRALVGYHRQRAGSEVSKTPYISEERWRHSRHQRTCNAINTYHLFSSFLLASAMLLERSYGTQYTEPITLL